MAATLRLYKVTTPTQVRLVQASNVQRAIAYAARHEITATIPAQYELYELARLGMEIECATDDPITDETRSAVAQQQIEMNPNFDVERYIINMPNQIAARHQGTNLS